MTPFTISSKIIERLITTELGTPRRYSIVGRGSQPEWFVADDELPAGEFAAGPFLSHYDADHALAEIAVKRILTTLFSPPSKG